MAEQYKYPKFEVVNAGLFNKIIKIENRFLQKLIEMQAMVVLINEFTVFAGNSLTMFKVVDDDTIYLECISTPSDARNQGSATKSMQAFIEAAKETNTKITLFACNVTGNGWAMMQHMVIATGMVKKNKIPVAKLKGWYEKFGFKAIRHDEKRKGWHMEYVPS